MANCFCAKCNITLGNINVMCLTCAEKDRDKAYKAGRKAMQDECCDMITYSSVVKEIREIKP